MIPLTEQLTCISTSFIIKLYSGVMWSYAAILQHLPGLVRAE